MGARNSGRIRQIGHIGGPNAHLLYSLSVINGLAADTPPALDRSGPIRLRPLQTPVRPSCPPSATPRTLTNPVASAAGYLTQNGKMNLNAMTTPTKKPKAPRPDFADAHKACRTSAEREQLALVLSARWTSDELHEYARLFYFRNGKDYATPTSYRRAIADLGVHYRGLGYPDAKPSGYPHEWLELFRKGGSKLLPPRREGLLQRGRGLSHYRISDEEYGWPGHTEEFRSMIEQRARDYFKISPDQPVHVNAWAASQRAYWREQEAKLKAAAKARAATAPKSRIRFPKRDVGRANSVSRAHP